MGFRTSVRSRALVEPEVLEGTPGLFCCAVWYNVSFLIWFGSATLRSVQQQRSVTSRMNSEYPKGHSNVSIVTRSAGPPEPDARDALSRVFDGERSGVKCLSTIVEGDGFWASTLKSAITSMRIDAGRKSHLGMHTSIDDAVAWLPALHAETTGVELDPAHLRDALQAFRARAVRDYASQ